MNTGRIGEAERYCTEMLDTIARQNILKPESPVTTAVARQLWEIYRIQKHSDDATRIQREYPAILKLEDRSKSQRLPDTATLKLEKPLLQLGYKHDQPSEATNLKLRDHRKSDEDRVSTPMNLEDDETAPSLENVGGSHHQSKMPSPEVLTKFERLLSMTTLTPDDPGSSHNAESYSPLRRQKRVSRMQTY